jgi:3',5'-cyclic AMP phosphodiesterase CpdA
LRILHFSDVHCWAYGLDADPTFKRFLGVANLLARRARKFPPRLAQLVVEQIVRTEADVVCFTGDISTSSLHREFALGQRLLKPVIDAAGERFLSVPGNHDRYTHRATRRALFEQYADGHSREFPYLRRIAGVDFLGIDSTRPCFVSSRGALPPARVEAAEALLRARQPLAPGAALPPLVVLSHYPYALPGGKRHRWNHRLEEAPAMQRLVAEHAPALYLHGHVHERWAHRPAATPATLCVNAGSAGMKSSRREANAGFVLIDLDERTGHVARVQAVALGGGVPESFNEWDLQA